MPALPLAALYFSIFVFLTEFYATAYGIQLAVLGFVYIFIRLLDAFSDPVVGVLSDKIKTRFGQRVPWVLVGCPIFLFSVWKLFVPDSAIEVDVYYLIFWLISATTGWTILYTPYQALGAELSDDYNEKARITFFRETFALIGTVVASVLYSIGWENNSSIVKLGIEPAQGLQQIIVFSTIVLLVAMVFLTSFVREKVKFGITVDGLGIAELWNSFRTEKLYQRLLLSYFLNGAANGFPPALFVFFVTYKLEEAAFSGVLLLCYFLAAIFGAPFWLYLSKRMEKHRLWCLAMIYASVIFLFVLLLGTGDLVGFFLICVFTGFALSADLALPPAIQADLVDLEFLRSKKRRTGAFFAFWGLAAKAAVAIATGTALIFLSVAGFDPTKENSGETLFYLSLIYAGAPIVLKTLSISLMWNFPLSKAEINNIESDGY